MLDSFRVLSLLRGLSSVLTRIKFVPVKRKVCRKENNAYLLEFDTLN